MPRTEVHFFRRRDGSIPLLVRLSGLETTARFRCLVRLRRLAQMGHELRRPEADYLRDKIYELRIRYDGQQLRILYFFHGQQVIVVSHGLTKEGVVPSREIDLAIARRVWVEREPDQHLFRGRI